LRIIAYGFINLLDETVSESCHIRAQISRFAIKYNTFKPIIKLNMKPDECLTILMQQTRLHVSFRTFSAHYIVTKVLPRIVWGCKSVQPTPALNSRRSERKGGICFSL